MWSLSVSCFGLKSFIYINRFFVWKSVCFGHGSGIRYSACLEELNIFSLLTYGNLNTSQICAQWKALVVDWARVLILEVSVKLCRESIFFKLMIFFSRCFGQDRSPSLLLECYSDGLPVRIKMGYRKSLIFVWIRKMVLDAEKYISSPNFSGRTIWIFANNKNMFFLCYVDFLIYMWSSCIRKWDPLLNKQTLVTCTLCQKLYLYCILKKFAY